MTHKYPNVNRIPDGPANINDSTRTVKIGYRAIGGKGGLDSVFNTLRQWIKGKPNTGDTWEAPNILCHWCVVVGDYYHQLQATDLLNWYENHPLENDDGWALYTVGKTSFNDIAIKNAAESTINFMPEQYHARVNNCQTFTISLLDKICRDGRVRVDTIYADSQLSYLPGSEVGSEEDKVEVAVPLNGVEHEMFLDGIKALMDEKAPPLTAKEIKRAEAANRAEEEINKQESS